MSFQGKLGEFEFILTDTQNAFIINKTTGIIMVHDSSLLDYDTLKPPEFNMHVSLIIEQRVNKPTTQLIYMHSV